MTVTLTPAPLSGSMAAIPSKSDAHRQLICAALADHPTRLHCPQSSEDIEATIRCLQALGARIVTEDGIITVTPIMEPRERALLDCGESGSTLRFLLPVAAALCKQVRLTGRGRLPLRPLGELTAAMAPNGVSCSDTHLPLTTWGRLAGGCYRLPGNISSQYISGLLFALPLLEKDSVIQLTTPLESADYVAITLHVLRQYGITVYHQDGGYRVPGSQRYRSPSESAVDGDWSNAAFFLAAGALRQPVTLTGLSAQSPQGDRRVVELLRRFGANITVDQDRVTAAPGTLRGQEIDIGGTPDLLPVLAVVAACAEGETRFYNAARLRLKESDRLDSTARLLVSLGGHAEVRGDELYVRGGSLRGGEVDSFRDHRIAMAAAVAAIACAGPVTVIGAEAVAKSYPGFFQDYGVLGGIHHGI